MLRLLHIFVSLGYDNTLRSKDKTKYSGFPIKEYTWVSFYYSEEVLNYMQV